MNDRFKFRAYSKELRKMYEVDTICPYEDNYTKGGEVFLKGIQYNSFYFPEEVEVMQCTGLKDKNGKLIYEGDIVEFYSQSLLDAMSRKGLARRVGQVVWNDEFLKFDVTVKSKAVPNLCKETDDNNFEVIGNIYENKELLESEG